MSSAGQSHELARYQLPDGTERVVCAQRVNGRVAVSDLPVCDTGRVYLIERHIESQAAMAGLVDAYIADSLQRGEPAAPVPADLPRTDV